MLLGRRTSRIPFSARNDENSSSDKWKMDGFSVNGFVSHFIVVFKCLFSTH